MKILHIVGGSKKGGAYKGAYILHKALKELKINSKILNDDLSEGVIEDIILLNSSFIYNIYSKIFIFFEKLFKFLLLPRPRSTFTFGILGFDITKFKEYKDADIIHIHWLKDGFINLRSISKINKPIIWTMRDMWPFTGGSHYTVDFENYEKSFLSQKIQKYKKKKFNKDIKFIAISDWLKDKAQKSFVLQDHSIDRIYNNVDIDKFKIISNTEAKSFLGISTKKKIILYGSQNPQNKRKGWKIFYDTLKKLDKDKFYLLIFGNFWSNDLLDEINIEYKSLGFINDQKTLNNAYSSSDLFVAPSIQEAFGKTWVEALSCNVPVVCFDSTSISENIEHKIDGYIVKNFNSNDLKDGIEWVSLKFNKENINHNFRNKVLQFDKNQIASKYIQVYEKILNK